MKNFTVGNKYFDRYICDWNTKVEYEVIKKTVKSLWVMNTSTREVVRKKLNIHDY